MDQFYILNNELATKPDHMQVFSRSGYVAKVIEIENAFLENEVEKLFQFAGRNYKVKIVKNYSGHDVHFPPLLKYIKSVFINRKITNRTKHNI